MGRNHVRVLLERDDVELAAVADTDSGALESALAIANEAVRGYEDPAAMIGGSRLDAVIVAVPTTRHFQVAMAAIERGTAVLVEKPISASIVEGRQLVRAAAERGVLLQAGHIERFNPAVLALLERLREGALTRIHSIKTVRGGPLPDRIRDVGVAIDLATHDIDVMCHVLGEVPIRVSAERSRHVHAAHEDLLYALLSFPSGIVGLLDANWLTPEKQRRLIVLGAEGMFEVDYLRQSLTFTRGAASTSPDYLFGFAPTIAGESVELPVEKAEPLSRELDAFLTSLRTGSAPAVSGADALAALALAKLALTAADEGRSLEVRLEIGV
jgi:predicted dehydrogenase